MQILLIYIDIVSFYDIINPKKGDDYMKKYLLPNDWNFYKANLHCHSTWSDGKHTPAELKELYKGPSPSDGRPLTLAPPASRQRSRQASTSPRRNGPPCKTN